MLKIYHLVKCSNFGVSFIDLLKHNLPEIATVLVVLSLLSQYIIYIECLYNNILAFIDLLTIFRQNEDIKVG